MTYDEFQRQLGKAGLTLREFAGLLRMNPNSITNLSNKGNVPKHLATISALMGEMAEHRIDFRGVLAKIEIEPSRPRGSGIEGKFGRTAGN